MSLTISLVELIDEFDCDEWGFTGTRAGMSSYQIHMFRRIITRGQPRIFRHGGAWGSDMKAHTTWKINVRAPHRANVWPAEESRAVLFRGQERVDVEAVMEPLTRNCIIVEKSVFMIATPNTEQEELRSSTWMTIRTSIKNRKPILIIWPDTKRMTLWRDDTLYRVANSLKDDR